MFKIKGLKQLISNYFIDFAFIFAQMKNGGLSLILFIPDTLFAEKKICKTKKNK